MSRLPVRKTYKLYIGGAFPRSESGRTYEAEGQNVARGSRKDVRDAVRAARAAQPGWAAATAYNRGQVLYRIAEMLESRADEFAELCTGRDEVERSIDRIVWYAGWADKLPQVLGGSNPVAGPYFNFTVPEPTGVVAVLAPHEPPLLGLVTRLIPPLVGGNAVVAVASETRPLAAIELAEALATSDVPGGVVNLLTGNHAELAPVLHVNRALLLSRLSATRYDFQYLKRRVSDALYARMLHDARQVATAAEKGPGGQPGNDSDASAAGSHPAHRLFGQATPGPGSKPTAPPNRRSHDRPAPAPKKTRKGS